MCRPQADGGSGNLSADMHCTRQLQRNGAAPWLSFQIKPPAASLGLFHSSGHPLKSERRLILRQFENHSAVTNLDSLQMMGGWKGGLVVETGTSPKSGTSRRQPAF